MVPKLSGLAHISLEAADYVSALGSCWEERWGDGVEGVHIAPRSCSSESRVAARDVMLGKSRLRPRRP